MKKENQITYTNGISDPHKRELGKIYIVEDLTNEDIPNNFMIVFAPRGVNMLNDECIEYFQNSDYTEARYVSLLAHDLGECGDFLPTDVAFTTGEDFDEKFVVLSVSDVAKRLDVSKKRIYDYIIHLYENWLNDIKEDYDHNRYVLDDLVNIAETTKD